MGSGAPKAHTTSTEKKLNLNSMYLLKFAAPLSQCSVTVLLNCGQTLHISLTVTPDILRMPGWSLDGRPREFQEACAEVCE